MKEQKTIEQYGDEWQKNAEIDPFYAILIDPRKANGQWSENDFFKTGRVEIDSVFDYMNEHGIAPKRTDRFLDFGCGVGRLSQALRPRFGAGLGIDISPRMIDLASRYNTAGNISFLVNTEARLAGIASGSIDFVYSNMVLQHMAPHLQRLFIAEFLRVLAPGGIAAFQIPTGELRSLASRVKGVLPAGLKNAIRRGLGRPASVSPGIVIEMHVLPEQDIIAIARHNHATVLACPFNNMTETQHEAAVLFLDRAEALDRVRASKSQHYYLSQFFFLRKDD